MEINQHEQAIQLLEREINYPINDSKLTSQIHNLIGKCQQTLENHEKAVIFFKESFLVNPLSFDNLKSFL